MGLVDRLLNRPLEEWAILLLAVLVAIPVHEFAHAWAATLAGDPTPERDGRVTLDPVKHLDPVGTILILLGGFGWGRPVMVNPYQFRSPRWGGILVAAAGPAANILMALALGVVAFRLGVIDRLGPGYASLTLHLVYINLGLAFFNLIPVPPLDGSKVLLGLLPSGAAIAVAKIMDEFGIFLLILVVMTGVTSLLVTPPADYLLRLFTGY